MNSLIPDPDSRNSLDNTRRQLKLKFKKIFSRRVDNLLTRRLPGLRIRGICQEGQEKRHFGLP
jgi:hypothetical protein